MSDIVAINNFELLPNEIIIECFQYLSATEIFYTFDRLNYRLHNLIRNIPLHINFENIRKSTFHRFCNTILVYPEIKSQTISLKLSNEGTCSQIRVFLSFFSLDEFYHLRSLTLIDLEEDNLKQIKTMLPLLLNLRYCFYTSKRNQKLRTLNALRLSRLETLSMPQLYFNTTSINEAMLVTSLIVSSCCFDELYQLFKYAPLLKYLKIKDLSLFNSKNDESCLTSINAVCVKQLIIESCCLGFQKLEAFLKLMPNLANLTISSHDNYAKNLFNAELWKDLIMSSLPHLNIFNFKWRLSHNNENNDVFDEFQRFQTDFWLKQHSWFTSYEFCKDSAMIYTVPYISHQYDLVPIDDEYLNLSINNSNMFNNVTNLTLVIETITNNNQHYFQNVKSLTLLNKHILSGRRIRSDLEVEHIDYLKSIVNLSKLKHLCIPRCIYIKSPYIMLQMLNETPQLSSIVIDSPILISFLNDTELCECFNKKIIHLKTLLLDNCLLINSKTRDLFCQRFSNLERLNCSIEKPDDFLFILTQLPKLSIIEYYYVIDTFPKDQYQWLEENISKLNMNFFLETSNTTTLTDIKYSWVHYNNSTIWIDRT